MSAARRQAGFTLLEVVVAMAILTLSLMAIFDLNAGAVSMHTYAKKVTVASLLARSKMTDIEQDLYDKGFPADDEERSGDFSDDGWSSFKWRAKIIAPKTNGVSTDQLLSAIFNVPGGGGGDALSGIASMFGGGGGGAGAAGAAGAAGGGPMAGMAQAQMTQFLDQISKSVREVHLTVTWKDGKQVESVDLVTHVVSLGPGSDRNGSSNPAAAAAAAAAAANGGVLPPGAQPPGSPGSPQPPGAGRGTNWNFPQNSFMNQPFPGGRPLAPKR